MKKTLSLLLMALMVFSLTLVPAAAQDAAALEILYENDYSTSTGLGGTGYSDAPSGTTTFLDGDGNSVAYSEMLKTFPQFGLSGGKLVYNTEGMSKTAQYPYQNQSDSKPVYARANFSVSGLLPRTADINTYEFDMQFGGEEFPYSFEFVIRYGAPNWVSGTTQDEWLFRVINGKITFGSGSYTISRGQNYRVVLLVDNTPATPQKTLYINGEKIGTAKATVSPAEDEALRTKLAGIGYIVRPYTGTNGEYTWKHTELAIDNFKMYSGDDTTDMVSLAADSVIYKSPNQNDVHTWVKAKSSLENDSFVYEMVTDKPGVSVDAATGKVTVTKDAVAGDVHQIKASRASDPLKYAVKTITVENTFGHDFEDGNLVGSQGSWSWSGGGTIETDDKGNKYASPSNLLYVFPEKKLDSGISAFTLEMDFLANGKGPLYIAGGDIYQNDVLNNGFWWLNLHSSSSTETVDGVSKDMVTLKNTRGAVITKVEKNSWVHIKMVYDIHEQYYYFIINHSIVSTTFKHDLIWSSGTTETRFERPSVEKLHFPAPVDNIKLYSGVEDNSTVLIPPEGKIATTQMQFGNDSNAVYSLAQEYQGVSIDPVTGVIYVSSSASEGSITAKAEENGLNYAADITLKKREMNDSSSKWNGSQADGYRVLPSSDYLRYSLNDVTVSGRVIIEMTARVPEDKSTSTRYNGLIGIAVRDYKDWPVMITLPSQPGEYGVRIVADMANKTYTGFIDGKPVTEPEKKMTSLPNNSGVNIFDDGELDAVSVIVGADVKDGNIYHVSCEALPEVYNISAQMDIGKPVSVSYSYFNESGLPEECSSVSYTLTNTAEETGTPVADLTLSGEDIGKFVTVTVTPACKGGVIVGADYKSAPMKVPYAYSYEIQSVNISGQDSEGDALIGGGTVTGVNVKKLLSYKEGTLYVALYKNGVLTKIAAAAIPAMTDGETKTITLAQKIELPETVSDCTVKAMIVDNALMPLASVLETRGYRGDVPAQLFLISDSLCQEYGSSGWPTQGWGKYIGASLSENITVLNKAKSGWSTKLYLDEETEEAYNWNSIKTQIQKGDYVLVALGINDCSTQSWGTTEAEYTENLKTMIQDTRAAGAEILFQTPTISGNAEGTNGWTYDTSTGWARRGAVMAGVAEQYGVPCLPLGQTLADTYNRQAAEYIAAGDSETDAYNKVRYAYHIYHSRLVEDWGLTQEQADAYKNGGDDTTHLNDSGAQAVAGIIAGLIKESSSTLADYVK